MQLCARLRPKLRQGPCQRGVRGRHVGHRTAQRTRHARETQAAAAAVPLGRCKREYAPAFNKGSVADYSNAILDWWRTNGTSFPAWALAARVVFVISPNSASCERVFALLKNLFGDAAMSALADYLQAGLMLNYNQRQVG